MAKIYLVWNKNRSECVGFSDKNDAMQAAGLKRMSNPCSSLADQWREMYADDEPKLKFEMQELDI